MKKFTSSYAESRVQEFQLNAERSSNQLKASLNQDKTLVLQLFNESKGQCYDLIIDDRYLKSRQDLSAFFSSPEDIHFTLMQLKDQLIISEDYRVILNVNLMASKVKMTKQFIFDLNSNPKKTLIKQRQKIYLLNQQISSVYGQLQFQKQVSRERQEKLTMQIREFSNQRNNLFYQLQEARQQIESFSVQLQQKNAENQRLQKLLQNKKDEISSYESSQNNSKSRIIELQNTLKTIQMSKFKQDLLINPANPHYYLFHYLNTDKGTIRIMKTGQNGWSNIITNPLLPQTEPTILQMKINRTKDGTISMGICNHFVLGNTDIDSPMAITYFVHDGRIFQKGTRKLSGAPIPAGQVLKLQIIWSNNTIRWWNEDIKVGQAVMDANFRLNNIFFIIRMYWKQDEIELK